MSEISKAFLQIVGVIASLFLSIAWAGFLSGYTASVLWGWFIVPVFGLPALGIAQAYGLAIAVRVIKGVEIKDGPERTFGVLMARAFFYPPVVAGMYLLIGWGVKQFL